MTNRVLKIALIGKTNAGKSTFINSTVGEKISIINKKINTTKDLILGIKNIKKTQMIFYDTPGSNFIKKTDTSKKIFKSIIWQAIDNVDIIIYIIDVEKYNFQRIRSDLLKINEVQKPIIVIFNKIDLINKDIILPYINELDKLRIIKSFFNISAKYKKGFSVLTQYLISQSKLNPWIFNQEIITNKDDIFISNECTRNAILNFLHKEIPYKLIVKNIVFKVLKNKHIKIKQQIKLNNVRYKPILLGKNGRNIKKIRELSQKEISKIFKTRVHLYLEAIK